jgi:hypothetical protein
MKGQKSRSSGGVPLYHQETAFHAW